MMQAEGARVAPTATDLLPFPIPGTPHAHTGCFHVECRLSGGIVLWLFGNYCSPKLEAGCPQFRVGQVLGGFLRSEGVASEEVQAELERSGVLAGLVAAWVEFPFPDMRRWFQFRVERGLVGELAERLHVFVSSRGSQAEPTAAPDPAGT